MLKKDISLRMNLHGFPRESGDMNHLEFMKTLRSCASDCPGYLCGIRARFWQDSVRSGSGPQPVNNPGGNARPVRDASFGALNETQNAIAAFGYYPFCKKSIEAEEEDASEYEEEEEKESWTHTNTSSLET
jgi:hypothetical protein